MLVFLVKVQEFLVIRHYAIQGEARNISDLGQVHTRVFRFDHLGGRINSFDATFDFLYVLCVDEIYLVQQDNVGKCYLLNCLVLALLLLIKSLQNPLTVYHSDYSIDAEAVIHLVVREKRLCNRCRIGHAGRLDYHPVERFSILNHCRYFVEGFDQVSADSATDAAIVHLDDIFLILELVADQRIIHAHSTEFVFDHGVLLLFLLAEDVIEQSRLSGT
mmetsp:Transcript_20399/g.33157  ORF Transcript_20399/g.33157 Transcript_20399/m.33157 type:complete len:218 (-) Transcript_20399:138-791(-)